MSDSSPHRALSVSLPPARARPAMSARAVGAFAVALAGCFYALMTFSVVVHEVVGHGQVAQWCGGRFVEFAVRPNFSGWARFTGVPDELRLWPQYGGIAVNLALGLLGVAAHTTWRHVRGRDSMALFWFGTVQLGQGLGYALQGMAFGAGDARDLAAHVGPTASPVVFGALAAGFAAVVFFAVRGVLSLILQHVGVRDRWPLRATFAGLIGIPALTLGVLMPNSGVFAADDRLAFYGALAAVVVVSVLWHTRRDAPKPDAPVRTIPLRCATFWALAGLGSFAVTAFWLADGVTM